MASRIEMAVFDIDGTLRRERSPWWHLHLHLGVAERAAGFSAAFRRGEVSYEEWAELDASLWRGARRERVLGALETNPLRAGARELVRWFEGRGIPCAAISTGLSVFAGPTASELGLVEVVCNELLFEDDVCAGRVRINVTEHDKGEALLELLGRRRIELKRAVVFGDGEADVPMMRLAGLSVAVCPACESVREAAGFVVEEEPVDSAVGWLAEEISSP